MGESRNRTGTTYALTVLSAILPGRTEEVRGIIEALPRGGEAPIARLGTVHTSRLHIFDHLVYQGEPQKPDRLRSDYLVFTAAFDGRELDPFLDALVDHMGDEADGWWRHCVAYPGMTDRAAFRRWIRGSQVHTSLFAVASPRRSVPRVLESLERREAVVRFAIENQGAEAADLQARFLETFGEAV